MSSLPRLRLVGLLLAVSTATTTASAIDWNWPAGIFHPPDIQCFDPGHAEGLVLVAEFGIALEPESGGQVYPFRHKVVGGGGVDYLQGRQVFLGDALCTCSMSPVVGDKSICGDNLQAHLKTKMSDECMQQEADKCGTEPLLDDGLELPNWDDDDGQCNGVRVDFLVTWTSLNTQSAEVYMNLSMVDQPSQFLTWSPGPGFEPQPTHDKHQHPFSVCVPIVPNVPEQIWNVEATILQNDCSEEWDVHIGETEGYRLIIYPDATYQFVEELTFTVWASEMCQ